MTSSTPTRSDFALCSVLTVALAMSPVAAAATPRSATELAKGQAAKARQAYAAGQYEDALALFFTANRLDPRPALLFNLAQCHRQLGELVESASLYERYLAQDVKGNAAQRKLARELLAEVNGELALLAKRRQEEAAERAAVETPPVAPRAGRLDELRAASSLTPPPATPELFSPPQVHTTPPSKSVFTTWWFWTGVALVTASAGTVAYVAVGQQPKPTLGTADLRGAK